jgi:RNA polymerase sigma-70 factor (ECF subfamily)
VLSFYQRAIFMEPEVRVHLSRLLPSMIRFAMTLTRSRQDADDLVQMTCERAISREAQWSPDTKLESWVFRIMQTVWLNELRARGVRNRHSDAGEPDEERAVHGERLVESMLELDRVEAEIFSLPEAERVVLLLVCVEGLTYREAAEVAGVPIGTIMSRLSRARLTLMARLEATERPASANVQRMSICRR